MRSNLDVPGAVGLLILGKLWPNNGTQGTACSSALGFTLFRRGVEARSH